MTHKPDESQCMTNFAAYRAGAASYGAAARDQEEPRPAGAAAPPREPSIYRAPVEPWEPSAWPAHDPDAIADVPLAGVDPERTVRRLPIQHYLRVIERGWAS